MKFRATIFLTLLLGLTKFGFAQELLITVTNTEDEGDGSLRAAIADLSPGGEITFDDSLDGGTIIIVSDDPYILSQEITIDASSLTNGITIDGNSDEDFQGRIFEIDGGVKTTLTNLILINGGTPAGADGVIETFGSSGENSEPGGAIYNSGTLILENCTLANNATGNGGGGGADRGGHSGNGGAIYNVGDLTLINCTLNDNQTGSGGDGGAGGTVFAFGSRAGSAGAGGAIANGSGATLTLTGCTFFDNQTGNGGNGGAGVRFGGNGGKGGFGGAGGALYSNGQITVTNCTFTGNLTGSGGTGGDSDIDDGGDGGQGGPGGGIHNDSENFSMTHCTVTNNQTGAGGLGGFRDGRETPSGDTGENGAAGGISTNAPITLVNSIVSANVATSASDFVGEINGDSQNITDSDFPILLRPLGDYGGPTFTMPPLLTSPALDASAPETEFTTDQRGFHRTINRSEGVEALADLGAVELQGARDEFDLFFSLDSDNDGISNGDELIVGSDPFVANDPIDNPLRLISIGKTTSAATLSFAYQESEIRMQVVRSIDMLNFETVIADSHTTSGFEPSDNGSLIEVIDTNPPAGGRAFYLLQTVRPE